MEIDARRSLFERELKEAEESGDPLSTWTSYLTWLEEQKPIKIRPYKDALQKSIVYFAKQPHYNADIRLASIYIKSANLSKDPPIIFKHMLAQEIGTQHAALYEAYANCLEQQGSHQEAMRVLEQGIARKAQPTQRLQKKLEILAVQSLQKPATQCDGTVVDVNDQSERNDAFYNPPGVVYTYPRQLVYPPEGGECTLEMLRASLPQYRPSFPNDCDTEEVDMEMTMAYPINITMNVPVIPDLFGTKKTLGLATKVKADLSGTADKENIAAQQHNTQQVSQLAQRKPLQALEAKNQSQAADEELERLCAEKDALLPPQKPPTPVQVECVDKVELELEQLMLEKSSALSAPVPHQKDIQDKENVLLPPGPVKGFDFTPNTLDGNLNWPMRGGARSGGGRGFATKLSFSEADSLSASYGHSLAADESTSQKAGRFNTTLECEKRVQVKLSEEQLKLQYEFGNVSATDVGEASWKQQSSCCSFDVFHDSWAQNQSRNNSQQLGTSGFRPVADKRRPLQVIGHGLAGRKPLQELPMSRPLTSAQESYLGYSQDPSHSFQPSQSDVSSFSVYEDNSRQESSFVPFHDSWASHSKNASGIPPMTSFQKVDTNPRATQPTTSENLAFSTYHVPLGVPVMAVPAHMKEGGNADGEKSFTQFDIPHPGVFEPASTPAKDHVDFTWDVSAIPTEVTNIEDPSNSSPILRPPRRSLMCAGNLSTIMEESGSYKSSGSSRYTSSSSQYSSSAPLESISSEDPPNPFLPHFINFMLNCHGSPMNKTERISGPIPRQMGGHSVAFGADQFTSVRKLTEGGFATIFTARQGEQRKALKVQTPPHEWEVAVVEELHSRLKVHGFHVLSSSFVQIEKAFRFDNASVIVTPYFCYGSLLDLVNAHLKSPSKSMMPETMIAYYTREIISAVATLHQCGILHADIKPDNFMLKNITQLTNFQQAKGRGLCLIDFGRAIDTQVFPEGTMFSGSSETDGFLCPQMLEGRPWKWQVDYFGIAATSFVLMHGEYMKVIKNPTSGLYKPNKSVPRVHDASMWSKLFDLLLNAPDHQLPLHDFLQPLDMKLKVARDFMFRSQVKQCQEVLQAHLSQH